MSRNFGKFYDHFHYFTAASLLIKNIPTFLFSDIIRVSLEMFLALLLPLFIFDTLPSFDPSYDLHTRCVLLCRSLCLRGVTIVARKLMSLSTMSAAKDSSWRTGKWPERWTDEWPPTTTALVFGVEIISRRNNTATTVRWFFYALLLVEPIYFSIWSDL